MSPAERVSDVDAGAIEFVLCDLDGVVWLAREAIPGAADAVARLRASGRRVLFVTNNSVSGLAEQEHALASIGIPAAGDVITSAQAGASLTATGERVLVCGGAGIVEAVESRGAVVLRSPEVAAAGASPDVVVVGLDREFEFETLHVTSAAVRAGARFIATNDDATFPTPSGLTPGAGSIVAGIATAAGVEPTIAGKPHLPMADLARIRCGDRFSSSSVLVIGDRWETDGAFAETIGCPFALVRSGVTAPGASVAGSVDLDAVDLGALVELLLSK